MAYTRKTAIVSLNQPPYSQTKERGTIAAKGGLKYAEDLG